MLLRKIFSLLLLLSILLANKGYCQNQSFYLYRAGGVANPPKFEETSGRPWKTSIDAGLVFGFSGCTDYTANYVNGLSARIGYTLGLIEDIPVFKTAYLQLGIEVLNDGVAFNSYFFAPGYSFLYNSADETYYHTVIMDEIQVPVVYKFPFASPDIKNRSLYGSFGAKFRYISYTNSTVVNTEGNLVYEGEKDVTSLHQLFSPFGSPMIEMGLGYQRNTLKKIRRGWYMSLDYDLGLFPLVYGGNMNGSNYIVFHLNTLVFKIGKLF